MSDDRKRPAFDPAKAYAHEQLMIRTKCEAEARIRADFQARWGHFLKCEACGARLEWRAILTSRSWASPCCSARVLAAGYTPPAPREP